MENNLNKGEKPHLDENKAGFSNMPFQKEAEKTFEEKKKAPPEPKEDKSETKSPSLLSVFSELDIDMSLILPLVLFLGKEGADELLILALIYIMS